MHDLVIRGGAVVDGSGNPPVVADVAIDGARITAVSEGIGPAREELDAAGLLVTPGWVDLHTHYDGQSTWDPWLAPSSWHGVTTAVMGNCGVGFAPVAPDRREWLIGLMEGVEDIPGTALHEGIRWEWETFPEYLDALGGMRRAVDIGAQVPHGALRCYVMGDRGADHEAVPTPEEIERMGLLAREAIEAGALGFTTSRTARHRSVDGRQTPSFTAGADELLGIAGALAGLGRGVFEMVSDFGDIDSEMALFREMSRVSGRPMSITTLQTWVPPVYDHHRVLDLIEQAAAEGVPLRGQVAARGVGVLIGLESHPRYHPLIASPTYGQIADLPLADRVRELRRTEVRESILQEVDSDSLILSRWPHAFQLDDPPRYDKPAELHLLAVAAREGRTILEVAYDCMLERDGGGLIYIPGANYVDGDFGAVREMLTHPWTLPGLGDAGAHCTSICDASFPTFLMTYWARDVAADQRLPVEWIVKRQCADTAALVGLEDRGRVAPGLKADLNLIDFDALEIRYPEMLYDLPTGARRLVQRANGYRSTLVNGEVTFIDGQPTGNLPGRLVRSSA